MNQCKPSKPSKPTVDGQGFVDASDEFVYIPNPFDCPPIPGLNKPK